MPLAQCCPACWRLDAQPCLRLAWLDRRSVRCGQHGSALLDAYPHCNARFRGSFALHRQWRCAPERSVGAFVVAHPGAGLRRCDWCGGGVAAPRCGLSCCQTSWSLLRCQRCPCAMDCVLRPLLRTGAASWQRWSASSPSSACGSVHDGQFLLRVTDTTQPSDWWDANAFTLRPTYPDRLDVRTGTHLTLSWLLHATDGTTLQRLRLFTRVIVDPSGGPHAVLPPDAASRGLVVSGHARPRPGQPAGLLAAAGRGPDPA